MAASAALWNSPMLAKLLAILRRPRRCCKQPHFVADAETGEEYCLSCLVHELEAL